jgi:hypothetical protein
METRLTQANEIASKLSSLQPRVWFKGPGKVRVYVKYPRGYQGGAGGGDLGYVDVCTNKFNGSAPADLLAQIKGAL